MQDKFRLDLSDEEAVHYMQSLIDESVGALFAAVVEQIHKFAQVMGGINRAAFANHRGHNEDRKQFSHSSKKIQAKMKCKNENNQTSAQCSNSVTVFFL